MVSSSQVSYQVAFAHWNRLASTMFDYQRGEVTADFTNDKNDFRTADSALAMYYDMGAVRPGATGKKLTAFYGVFKTWGSAPQPIWGYIACPFLCVDLCENGNNGI